MKDLEIATGSGTSRPWRICDGEQFMDMVLMPGSEIDMAHIMIRAKRVKDPLIIDQWWDANLQETRVLLRWGSAINHGGVEHLIDGGHVVRYPDGRYTQ